MPDRTAPDRLPPSREAALSLLTARGEPYELVDAPTARGIERVFTHAPVSLRQLYTDNLGDETFIVYEHERYTFAEAWRRASAIGRVLVGKGVRPGDRVAISMRNYPEWMLTFCAVTSIGGVVVAMNSLWTADEMEYALDLTAAAVIVVDQERLDRLAECSIEHSVSVLVVRPTGAVPSHAGRGRHPVDALSSLVEAAGSVEMPEASIDPDDPATIVFTSGSTGHPKGVLSTHRSVLSALLSWEVDSAQAAMRAPRPNASTVPEGAGTVKRRPVALLGVPLFHVLGLNGVFLSSYRSRRTVVCMYKWDPEVAVDLIEREAVTAVNAPPAMTGDLVRVAASRDRDLSSLAVVGGGGAARAPEQVRQIAGAFARAVPSTGWGMTETNAIGTTIAGSDYLEHPGSAGRCLAVMQLRVVDDLGGEVPAGERGELQVRGTAMFREYWNRPDATAEALTADGWFRTGDVAVIDGEGYLYIVDRIKDLIIRGGENIGCGGVEAVLLEHPDVFEAAVFAVPDDRLGEEVGATVHGRPGLDLEALREFARSRLPRHEVPRYIWVSDVPLPRTGSGKLFKRQLRDAAVGSLDET
jgi:long-chain acyl-CoA synthetase